LYREITTFSGQWTDNDSHPGVDGQGRVVGEFWNVVVNRAILESFGVNWTHHTSTWRGDNWKRPQHVAYRLTGYVGDVVSTRNADYRIMRSDLYAGRLIVASTHENLSRNTGLQRNHAYAVLRVATNGNVTLRNPYRDEASSDNIRRGTFTISWRHFINCFASYVSTPSRVR
jgi:hypothetical protein